METIEHATIDLVCPNGHQSRHMLSVIDAHGHFVCPECLQRTRVPRELVAARVAEIRNEGRPRRAGR